MKKIFLFFALIAFVKVNAQQITYIEYFFDNDPGKGNGTAIAGLTAASVISDFNFTVSTASLTNGMHTLFTRSKNNLGEWSIVSKQILLKQPITVAGNITKLEYFFDNDPGFGNATNITGFTSGTTINDFVFTADATALSNGPHFLYVRSKDDWSITNKILFYKQPITVAGNITKLEYFFDNDPGFGNATNITGFTPGTTINDFVFTADATTLSNGPHFLYVRSKDDWSITNKILFYKQPITVAGNITKLEYFFDNDPGFGNATNITGFTPGTTINDFVFTADATALSNGPHFLYVRSKDDWSITNKILFYKQPITVAGNITKLEYFFDNDPGFGNATDITGFIPGTTINDFVFTADATTLSNGPHFLYVRSKDDWSITNKILFYRQPVEALTNITQIEYFIDKDPGFGNATPVSFSPTNPLSDLVFSANFSGYSTGLHYFFIRSKDASGRWSLTNVMQYNQTTVLPLNWISFTAKKQNTTSLLQWQTANEQNVTHFEIERSADGLVFEKIGVMVAKDGLQNDYAYTDSKVIAGKNYYRIKQIDRDDKYSFTSIAVVDFGKQQQLITILNNPSANPVIKIISSKIASVVLFDATGKLLQKINTKSGNAISMGNYTNASGNYFITLLNNEGLVLGVEKLVLQK